MFLFFGNYLKKKKKKNLHCGLLLEPPHIAAEEVEHRSCPACNLQKQDIRTTFLAVASAFMARKCFYQVLSFSPVL